MLGRRLRLALIGGGPGSFIGAMHRQAARLDDRYEVVCGVLCSDPDRSRAAGRWNWASMMIGPIADAE
jgi:predicted dehydrogenase